MYLLSQRLPGRQWRIASPVLRELGHDKFELSIEFHTRHPIEQLEGIRESHRDRFRPHFGKETIIVAPATTQAVAVECKGEPGNQD